MNLGIVLLSLSSQVHGIGVAAIIGGRCDHWCDRHSCDKEECSDCGVCEGKYCVSWCNEYTCASHSTGASCDGCCGCKRLEAGIHCASWCNKFSCWVRGGFCDGCVACGGDGSPDGSPDGTSLLDQHACAITILSPGKYTTCALTECGTVKCSNDTRSFGDAGIVTSIEPCAAVTNPWQSDLNPRTRSYQVQIPHTFAWQDGQSHLSIQYRVFDLPCVAGSFRKEQEGSSPSAKAEVVLLTVPSLTKSMATAI